MKIPVNILDKVKYELNAKNPHQYFYTFLTFSGTIDIPKMQLSFHKLYQLNEKLNYKLTFDGDKYEYKPSTYPNCFYQIDYLENEEFNPHLLIEKRASDYIECSHQAPVILLVVKKSASFCLVFLHNHIFYDGTTAYNVQNQLMSLYNDVVISLPHRVCSDDEAIIERIKSIPNFNQVKYCTQIIKHVWSSLKYTSSFNRIIKIYKNKPVNDVRFYHITIPNPKNSAKKGYSTNTMICAHIANAFLQVKGDQTGHTVSMAIPSNFRSEIQSAIWGNLVNSISVKVTKKISLNRSYEVIQRKTGLFKNYYREIAAYKLLNILAKKKKGESLIKTFRQISKKHHFYVTNLGDFSQRYNISLTNCEIIDLGGFNFPIQEDYGLIFTVVPFGDVVKIGIATSSDILSDGDVNRMRECLSNTIK